MASKQDVSEAFNTIKKVIQTDPGYAWSWHCNIAMAFQDEGGKYAESNKAAARFMQSCFGVDTLPNTTTK